ETPCCPRDYSNSLAVPWLVAAPVEGASQSNPFSLSVYLVRSLLVYTRLRSYVPIPRHQRHGAKPKDTTMDTLPNPHYSKEMVDLLIRIKKHLLANQDIAIRLSDPDLFDKLVKLHPKDDPLLQGMIQYLMVLAGPQW